MTTHKHPFTDQIGVAVYYVLAIKPVSQPVPPLDRVQQCLYFSYEKEKLVLQKPDPVSGRVKLHASSGGTGLDYLCLKQLVNLDGCVFDPPLGKGIDIDKGVTLVSAVAGAQDPVADQQLPSTFVSSITEKDSRPSVVIPVSPGASRGAILIFEEPKSTHGCLGLRASLDPEIRGSTEAP